MVNSEKRQFSDDRCIDPADQNSDGEESVDVSFGGVEAPLPSISRRLTEIFLVDGDEDLLLQRSDKEDGVLHWLRALDLHVMGACRVDERLKPLLKLNLSSGEAEDRLLAQLCEHFEPSEVGLLARCLCAPLVSIRVGKINKQGTLLSPTSIRGNLCLTLLPTSDLRISFNGDDGYVERVATLSAEAPGTVIKIEEIAADKSGRSFVIKITDGMVCYFWFSEKSQLLGNELLRKMKDLLMRRPSLAELTGISEGRLNSFATDLRAFLGGSTVVSAHSGGRLSANAPSNDNSFDSSEIHFPQSSFTCENSSCVPQSPSKDGRPESSSAFAATEKLMARGEDNVLHVDSLSLAASTNSGDPSNSNLFQKIPVTNGLHPLAKLNSIDAFGKPAELPNVQLPSSCSSHFSPHYCWCPPLALTLEGTLVNSQLPISSTESLRLPPLSSLLSAARPSSLLTSKSSLNSTETPPVGFPSFFPDPLIRLPTSQQIPTFTPLMCDPIVHIPVIDVCSSGPGYLVSAGPDIAPTLPPLSSNLVVSSAESVVEKSARETLRMLISNTNQPNLQLLEVLPSVLSRSDDVFATRNDSIDKKQKPFNSGFDAGTE